jgi:uncharacterized membrane protein YoaK (UPF0700 family)
LTDLKTKISWESTTPLMPFVLTAIAGSADTIAFLSLNRLFVAHITGDLVILAARLITGDRAVLSFLLAPPVFLLALFVMRLAASLLESRRIHILRPMLCLELIALLACLGLSTGSGGPLDQNSAMAVAGGMCGVTAMAIQTALIEMTGAPFPASGVMTTTAARLVLAVGEFATVRDRQALANARRQLIHTYPVLIGFCAGCALGAKAQHSFGARAFWLPVGLTLAAIAISLIPDEYRTIEKPS